MTFPKRIKDSEGNWVKAGDLVGFSYGIPPICVRGRVVDRNGVLMLPTPGHTPEIASLKYLRRLGILFSKLEEPPNDR